MNLPPFDQVLGVFLNDVLPPGLAAAGVLGLSRLLFGRRAGSIGAVLALAAGFAVGNWFLAAGLTSGHWRRELILFLPEHLGLDYLYWAALGAMVVGLITRIPGWPERHGWVVPATTALAGCLLILEVDQKLGAWPVVLFAVVAAAEWAIAEEQSRRQPVWLVPLFLAVVFVVGGAVLLLAHSLRFFELAQVLGSTLAAIAFLSWICRLDVGSVVPGAVVALCGLLQAGLSQTYSDVPNACFVLVALAPLMLGATLLPPLARWKTFLRAMVQVVLLAIPLAAALLLAGWYESLPDGG